MKRKNNYIYPRKKNGIKRKISKGKTFSRTKVPLASNKFWKNLSKNFQDAWFILDLLIFPGPPKT